MNRSFGGTLDCQSVNYNKGKSFRFSEWNSSTLFSNDDFIQDFVSYMGSMYACIQTNTGVKPTNELYWKLVVSGQPGVQGKTGNTGVTFTPHVDSQGNLSWTNDGGLENPVTVNIKGPKGEDSTVPGPKGDKGDDGIGLMGPQGRTGEMGIGLEFNWDGTKLGIKRTVDEDYTYVDLKGSTGARGLRGLTGNVGPEGQRGPKGDSLYIQVSEPNEFGQRFLQKRYNENEAWVSFFDLSQMKGPKGDTIIVERNTETGNIEYRYQNQPSTANKILIYKDDIKGPKGDTIGRTYVADDGYLYIQLSGEDLPRRVGYVRGDRGADGREIVLRVYTGPSEDPDDTRIGTHLQWKYAGDEYKLWTNLIQINDLMNVALAGLKLEYKEIKEADVEGVETKYEVIELSHYQVEFDENNNLVLTKKIANLTSVKVPTKTLLSDVQYTNEDNKLHFIFDTATGEEEITIDCDQFIRQGNGITISDGNIINVNISDDSDKLSDDSEILICDERGVAVRGLKDKLIKEFNLLKHNRDNDTHYYSYEYIAQNGTVYPISIPDFVEWADDENTRNIHFRNNDKLVSWDVDKIIRNLVHLDGTDTVQVGDSKVSINLNGKDDNPTYNNDKLALTSNLEDEIAGLHLVKQDTPDEPDIAARYYLADKDNELLGNIHIDILKDNYLKEVTYNEDTYTFTFDFWVNDDPEESAHNKIITFTLQKLFDDLSDLINEVDDRLSKEIEDLEIKHDEEVKQLNETIATVNNNLVESVNTINKNMADGFNTINGGINNEIRPAIEKNSKDISELRTDLDEEIARRDEIKEGLDNLVAKTDKINQDLIDTNNNLSAEILRATNAESEIYKHIHELEENVVTSDELDKKEDAFTVGVGLEMTSDRVLNVTLDTTVFKVITALPDQPLPEDMQKIHLVPSDVTGSQNIYKEYIWANNAWELLGEYQSEVDLTPYLTKEEAKTTYQPVGDYATKTELADGLVDKQPVGNYATKEELANVSNQIPSLEGYATEEWVTDKNYLTSIPDNYVTEEELNAKNFALKSDLDTKQDKLVSGEGGNLATINGADLLQGGNIVIETPEGGISDAPTDGNTYARKNGSWTTVTIPDVSNLATKDEIPTKVSQLENDSNFLTKVPAEYVTDEELNTKGYLTSIPEEYVTNSELQEAIADIHYELPTASADTLGGIKVGSGLTINSDTGVLSATGGGVADAVDWANVQSKPQINGHELIGGNNTLDSLGIQPAGDYALKSEIPSLNGYATESWVSSQGYLTSVPDNYVTDNELTEAINGVKYTLPTASTDTLGGIKIGAGLSITGDGILSATGGGTADAVEWDNVLSKPSWITEDKPVYNYNEIEGTIPVSKLPIATTESVGVVKIGSGLAITREGVLSATGGGVADSVDWSNVENIPEWITNTKPIYNYNEIEGNIPTNKLPIATTTSVGAIKVGSGLTVDGEGLLSSTISVISELDPVSEQPVSSSVIYEALTKKQDILISGETLKTINGTSLLGSGNIVIEAGGGGSEIMDVLDDKIYARTQGTWVDLTDWLTWAELD